VKRIIEMLMVALGTEVDKADAPIYPDEEIGSRRSRRRSRGGKPEAKEEEQRLVLTIESAAQIINELPSDVPRESALRIVRGTLAATGIEVSNLERFIQARASKLNWEIELARNRQEEIQQKTEEAVRSLKEEIKKARETCETILAEEERKISEVSRALKDVGGVRDFFGLPKTDQEENISSFPEDTQPLDTRRT
jgi:hypothetical protein